MFLCRVIFKPADLTLAVLFRYWMHSTAVMDVRFNLAMLLPLLDPPVPPHVKAYLEQHPPPDMHALLPRIVLGASKTAGSDRKKRTPGQAADAIVSASAAHFERLELEELRFEYNFFHALLRHSEKENRAFVRAVFRSSALWVANAQVMRRSAASDSRIGEGIYIVALTTYSIVALLAKLDGKEFIDALVSNWMSTGLFDVLEDTVDFLLNAHRGPCKFPVPVEGMALSCLRVDSVLLVRIIAALDGWVPQMSTKTRKLVRSQLPRPRLTKRLLASGFIRGEEDNQRLRRDHLDFVSRGMNANPQNTMFIQGARQVLEFIARKVEEPGECARRGCEKKVDTAGRPEQACHMCKITEYCSITCLDQYVSSSTLS